jgi:hypothetical protein
MQFLKNHTSFETAYEVKDYPYGFRLRTSIFYWIETTPKRGDRFCTCTIDPRNGRVNAPKKSTYYNLGFMYLNAENHVKWTTASTYGKKEAIEALVTAFGGVEELNKEQKKQYNALFGINEVKTDEFTGKVKKDFSVKWDRETVGNGWKGGVYNKGEKGNYNEVKITFDRPDGVKMIEIFKAMKSLDQDKLKQVYAMRESISFGSYPGVVRICCRGGVYLGEISEEAYKKYLASDHNTIEEEKITNPQEA